MVNLNGVDEFNVLVDKLISRGSKPANAAAEARQMLAAQGQKVAKDIKPGKLLSQTIDDTLNINGKPAFSAADIKNSAFRAPGVVNKGGELGKKVKVGVHKNAKAATEGAKAYTEREAARVANDAKRVEVLKPHVDALKQKFHTLGDKITEAGRGFWNAVKKHPIAASVAAAAVIIGGIMLIRHNSNKDVEKAA